MTLPKPRNCPRCKSRGTVISTRTRASAIYRRHQCRVCGRRWPSWESLINPMKVRFLFKPAGSTT
jgi:transcriptional regulator NrdR family protein